MHTTLARVTQLLDYDPDTGVFVWKENQGRRRRGHQAGTIHRSGYVQIGIDGRLYLAHRLAWLYAKGQWPSREVDHRNRVRTDNRIGNLRLATRKQNSENLSRRRDNTTGHTGVYWLERVGKWYAQIRHNGRQIHLGYFSVLAEAVLARKTAERLYFTHAS